MICYYFWLVSCAKKSCALLTSIMHSTEESFKIKTSLIIYDCLHIVAEVSYAANEILKISNFQIQNLKFKNFNFKFQKHFNIYIYHSCRRRALANHKIYIPLP